MTKIYLILQFDCDEKGVIISNTKKTIEVFTNLRLAKNAVDYLNKDWREAFTTKDFKEIKWYVIQMHTISHLNYKKLSF